MFFSGVLCCFAQALTPFNDVIRIRVRTPSTCMISSGQMDCAQSANFDDGRVHPRGDSGGVIPSPTHSCISILPREKERWEKKKKKEKEEEKEERRKGCKDMYRTHLRFPSILKEGK